MDKQEHSSTPTPSSSDETYRKDFAEAALRLVLSDTDADFDDAVEKATAALLGAVGKPLEYETLAAVLECTEVAANKCVLYGEINAGIDQMVKDGRIAMSNGRYGLLDWVPADSEKIAELTDLFRHKLDLYGADTDLLASKGYWTEEQIEEAKRIVRREENPDETTPDGDWKKL